MRRELAAAAIWRQPGIEWWNPASGRVDQANSVE